MILINGYLALQGNLPFITAQSKHIVKLLARKRPGIRWAKYPCSRCRSELPIHAAPTVIEQQSKKGSNYSLAK